MRWAGSSRRRLTAVRRTKRSATTADVNVAEGSSAAEDDCCAAESELEWTPRAFSLEDIVPSLWLPSYVDPSRRRDVPSRRRDARARAEGIGS